MGTYRVGTYGVESGQVQSCVLERGVPGLVIRGRLVLSYLCVLHVTGFRAAVGLNLNLAQLTLQFIGYNKRCALYQCPILQAELRTLSNVERGAQPRVQHYQCSQ